MQNIVRHFINAAQKFPDKIVIIEVDNKITFEELEISVKQTAAYLKQKGVNEGDRVLVFIPPSVDLYRTVLAIFYIGATAVFLDEWVSKKRMELCCKIADCKALTGIFKVRVFSVFSSELRKIPIKLGTKFSKKETSENYVASPSYPALITFTTGSTGTPKAAKRTHEFLDKQFEALLHEIKPKETDIDMTVLPIVMFINLGIGCTSVIANFNGSKAEKMNSKLIINQIKDYNINRLTASPFFIKKLSEYINNSNSEILNLEKIFTGGAPVFPNEAETYKKAFPNTNISIVYGSTEAEPISTVSAKVLIKNNNVSKGLLVGKTYKNAVVKIIKIIDDVIEYKTDAELSRIFKNENEIGEIIVSGKHVLKEYYNNEEAFKRNKIVTEENIWHRTGDSGFLDSAGNLFLTGRCKQIIYKDDKILSPFIVENILMIIEGVEIGTVLKQMEKIFIVIEKNENFQNEEKIKSEIKQNLNFTFENIIFIKKIPRDPRHNSKIDYAKLSELI